MNLLAGNFLSPLFFACKGPPHQDTYENRGQDMFAKEGGEKKFCIMFIKFTCAFWVCLYLSHGEASNAHLSNFMAQAQVLNLYLGSTPQQMFLCKQLVLCH